MKFALLFPGQGSQKVGMGKDLLGSSIVKSLFKKTDEITRKNISDVFLNGPEEELNQTKNTQPAIVSISIALILLLQEKLKKINLSIEPVACCGHSLGEFTALWYLNILSFEDLIKLVSIRGNLMQNTKEGSMAAILNLTQDKILGLLNKEYKNKLVIANHNTPNQFVISGEKRSIEEIQTKIKELNGKVIILPVSGAFHSHLMEEASNIFNIELEKLLSNTNINTNIPIYQNYDGQGTTEYKLIKEKTKKQMTSSVLWTQTINNLVNNGVNAVLEIGPGKVLTGLVKKINSNVDCYNIFDLNSLNEFVNNYECKFTRTKT